MGIQNLEDDLVRGILSGVDMVNTALSAKTLDFMTSEDYGKLTDSEKGAFSAGLLGTMGLIDQLSLAVREELARRGIDANKSKQDVADAVKDGPSVTGLSDYTPGGYI